MKNIEDYDAGFGGFLTASDDFTEEDGNLDYMSDRRVVIDYDDFLDLARENGALKNKLNYILRALRIGLEPPTISALFDDEEDFDADKFLEMNFFDNDHEGLEEKADE